MSSIWRARRKDDKKMFEIRDIDLAGRIGKLKTKSGVIETPYLFPVIDPTLKEQYVKPNEMLNLGFSGIITNAYLLKKHVGIDYDVHKYLGFEGVIMTDSGAYQILKYGHVDVTNSEILEYQCTIRSDIGVILDIPTTYEASYEEAYNSAFITLQRAEEAIRIITSQYCKDILWVLPIQGGVHIEILREFAKKSVEVFYNGFSIFAVGSPTTLLEQYMFDKVIDMIFAVRSSIPFAAPLHLFGAGHPLILPFAVALGVDLFDSASYILYAKDGRYITRRGTYRFEELEYFPCSCPVCSKYSPRELREMAEHERIKLLALHNLYVLIEELKEIKQAIKENRFWEYLEARAQVHPAARRAFNRLLQYLEFLYKHTPYSSPDSRAVFILSSDSVYNPRVLIPRRKVLSIGRIQSRNKKVIVLVPYISKNSMRIQNIIDDLISRSGIEASSIMVYLYLPVLGLVPLRLMSVYPFSQFEVGLKVTEEIINDLAYLMLELILLSGKTKKVIVLWCMNIQWNTMLINRLIQIVKNSMLEENVHFVPDVCENVEINLY
jgi:7-cyano-7-deazaguanine tRNA-ribosyltransferase